MSAVSPLSWVENQVLQVSRANLLIWLTLLGFNFHGKSSLSFSISILILLFGSSETVLFMLLKSKLSLCCWIFSFPVACLFRSVCVKNWQFLDDIVYFFWRRVFWTILLLLLLFVWDWDIIMKLRIDYRVLEEQRGARVFPTFTIVSI